MEKETKKQRAEREMRERLRRAASQQQKTTLENNPLIQQARAKLRPDFGLRRDEEASADLTGETVRVDPSRRLLGAVAEQSFEPQELAPNAPAQNELPFEIKEEKHEQALKPQTRRLGASAARNESLESPALPESTVDLSTLASSSFAVDAEEAPNALAQNELPSDNTKEVNHPPVVDKGAFGLAKPRSESGEVQLSEEEAPNALAQNELPTENTEFNLATPSPLSLLSSTDIEPCMDAPHGEGGTPDPFPTPVVEATAHLIQEKRESIDALSSAHQDILDGEKEASNALAQNELPSDFIKKNDEAVDPPLHPASDLSAESSTPDWNQNPTLSGSTEPSLNVSGVGAAGRRDLFPAAEEKAPNALAQNELPADIIEKLQTPYTGDTVVCEPRPSDTEALGRDEGVQDAELPGNVVQVAEMAQEEALNALAQNELPFDNTELVRIPPPRSALLDLNAGQKRLTRITWEVDLSRDEIFVQSHLLQMVGNKNFLTVRLYCELYNRAREMNSPTICLTRTELATILETGANSTVSRCITRGKEHQLFEVQTVFHRLEGLRPGTYFHLRTPWCDERQNPCRARGSSKRASAK